MTDLLPPAARALAERHAAEDRELLASLIRRNLVTRDARVGAGVPGAAAFRREIETIVAGRAVNLAIRPKKKRR